MLQSFTECYRALQSITECYRVLQIITEYNRVIQNITEYYRVFLAHLLGPISGLVFACISHIEIFLLPGPVEKRAPLFTPDQDV